LNKTVKKRKRKENFSNSPQNEGFSSILRRIWLTWISWHSICFFRLLQVSHFFRISNIFGLSTAGETWIVEMHICHLVYQNWYRISFTFISYQLMALFYLRIKQIWRMVTRHVWESTAHYARLRRFIILMKHATNIYSVHFTTLILLDFFFQMYASIPKSRIEIKTPNYNYWNAESHWKTLLHSINLSRGKINDENFRTMCLQK
jgi:hypothetical protein